MEIFKILITYFDFLLLKKNANIYESLIKGKKTGVLYLQTKYLKIKLIYSTRNPFYLEISSIEKIEWVELSLILNFLRLESITKNRAIALNASLLLDNYDSIVGLFKSCTEVQKLLDFRYKESQSRW
jgi:hypothetical protein